jgi:hypothetical protein
MLYNIRIISINIIAPFNVEEFSQVGEVLYNEYVEYFNRRHFAVSDINLDIDICKFSYLHS